MIKEAYCSYEISKLLKEKGFDEPCIQMWECGPDKKYLFRLQSSCYQNITEEDSCLAPTHQMAMKWLREVYKLHIAILWDCVVCIGKNSFCYHIYRIDNYEDKGYNKIGFDSNEEAVEAALKYSLENLI